MPHPVPARHRTEPDNNRGYYNLGAMYILEGRLRRCHRALNRSIELRPSMTLTATLGSAYFYRRRYSEAITMYEKARALDDKDYLNWGNLADALYWSPGRRNESAAAYKQAIGLAQARAQDQSEGCDCVSVSAQYSAMIGDKVQRRMTCASSGACSPGSRCLFRAAQVYNQLGDQRQTLDWLEKAVAANFSQSYSKRYSRLRSAESDPAFQSLIAGI